MSPSVHLGTQAPQKKTADQSLKFDDFEISGMEEGVL